MNDRLIVFRGIRKLYPMGESVVRALDGVDLEIDRGSYVSIIGPSGSGKSTMMNIVGCLDTPTEGEYLLEGQPISSMTDNQLADIRNRKIGFVFQGFNLLPRLSALENVELPLIYLGASARKRKETAAEALTKVGLGDRLRHMPTELSGGQQQRVAIARALVTTPPIILADEPTGNLDSRSGREVLALLGELNRQGNTVLLITHDSFVASQARRRITISDGRILSDEEV